MSAWTYSKADRLTESKRHARAILDALLSRRCDAVRSGDRREVAALDVRIAATTARWRTLCACARREKRAAALSC